MPTIFSNAAAICITSSTVLFLLREIRIVPLAYLSSSLIAFSTCEISVSWLLHAEPVDTAIPIKSNLCRIASPSLPSKERLMSPGSVSSPPFLMNAIFFSLSLFSSSVSSVLT